jgi:hypothetical protein
MEERDMNSIKKQARFAALLIWGAKDQPLAGQSPEAIA